MKLTGWPGPIRALFRSRDFRSLVGSQLLAGMGEWLATMALIALVWERTHSAVASGLVLVFRILPAAVLGTVLGQVVDRLDRKRVMVACNAGRALVYGSLPLVAGTAPVLALALVAEVAAIAYATARDATLPRLVPAESLPTANAVSMASAFGMMPIGSGLFALMGLTGRHAVTLALAAAGAALAAATIIVGRVSAHAAAGGDDAPVREAVSFREGIRALVEVFREDAILRRVGLGAAIAAAGGGAVMTLGLAFVRGTLNAGPNAYSALLMAFCAGALAGIVSLQRFRGALHHVFHGAVGVMGFILVTMALFPSTVVGIGMSFLFGGAFVATFLGGITILQDRVRDSLRGRAFGLAHSVLRAGAVLMGLVAAWVAKAIGETPRSISFLRMDGNQLVLAAAGLLLFATAATLLRPARIRARA
ncbi:MAG: MFS transporter [Actinomycetota bacterium]